MLVLFLSMEIYVHKRKCLDDFCGIIYTVVLGQRNGSFAEIKFSKRFLAFVSVMNTYLTSLENSVGFDWVSSGR